MNRRTGILMVLGIIGAVAIGGTQAAISAKHSHGIKTGVFFKAVSTPAFEVGGDFISCPGGYKPTGGGVGYVDGIAHPIASGFLDPTTYYTLIDNFDSSIPSTTEVQIACIKGKTATASVRPLTRKQIDAKLDAKVEALEAAHRAAK